jgi:hypothetical protein
MKASGRHCVSVSRDRYGHREWQNDGLIQATEPGKPLTVGAPRL